MKPILPCVTGCLTDLANKFGVLRCPFREVDSPGPQLSAILTYCIGLPTGCVPTGWHET